MKRIPFAIIAVALVSSCTTVSNEELTQKTVAVLRASFNEKGQARLDRIDQDETQRLCSIPHSATLSKDVAAQIEKTNLATIRYPADGKLVGHWREGEKIAQSGVGMQYTDDPKKPAGANCYACHKLTKEEISFGTMGPSLYNFGKVRGNTEATQRYVYGKIYNSEAYSACSNMPRFGHKGILTEQQIKDVTALLLDPDSPVNK
jgi:sulfur-oxidizing protein SoxX